MSKGFKIVFRDVVVKRLEEKAARAGISAEQLLLYLILTSLKHFEAENDIHQFFEVPKKIRVEGIEQNGQKQN